MSVTMSVTMLKFNKYFYFITCKCECA